MSMRDDPRRRTLANYPFRFELQPRFGDMDVLHHFNNATLARFYEEGRVRFHAELRARFADYAAARGRVLVAHVSIDYLAEGHYPEPLTLGLGVLHLGTRSYRLGLGLFQNGSCLGLCDTVLVQTGEQGSGPLPAIVRAALESYRFVEG